MAAHSNRPEDVETQGASGSGPTLRIAIASRDGQSLNAHFGSAERFLVYDVSPGGHAFVRAIEMSSVSDESGDHKAESEDKNARKIALLAGCHIVFVLAIGGPVATKVIHAGIHPIKIADPEPVDSVVSKVRTLMTTDPPPWLRKVLTARTSRSMKFLDEDE
ncbi:MAG TPA: nitrogen fixation protein NifX [Polyangiaceae bacterium]|nr:nitrogen fixation protein NifX [Polyangiaceae bacterium]